MQYSAPTTIDAALEALSARPWIVLAGGTDVYPALRDRPLTRDTLDITRIEGLRGIDWLDTGGWRIGATTTWTDIVRADLPPSFAALREAAREVGSVQIQNTGTIAGNLCNASPAADGVPPLLVLDAEVEIRSAEATRRVPLKEFLIGPRQTALKAGELVTAVLIPPGQEAAGTRFEKLGARRYLVISIAMVASLVERSADGTLDHVRVSVGACSAVAQRLPDVEAALAGVLAEPGAIRARLATVPLDALCPLDDVRGSAAYRMDAARELIARAVISAADEPDPLSDDSGRGIAA